MHQLGEFERSLQRQLMTSPGEGDQRRAYAVGQDLICGERSESIGSSHDDGRWHPDRLAESAGEIERRKESGRRLDHGLSIGVSCAYCEVDLGAGCTGAEG